MGIPKFFRYISERYPCLSEMARDQHMPEFDNLYLDMNGIIHNCTHPDDSNISHRLSLEEMFKSIFNYIDKLFFLIKPQRLFYMAVDGVAPRAKMNQQRCRRFRSAKETQLQEQIALRKGIEIPPDRFDTNSITPGTEFMVQLQTALRYFVKCKISADPLWQRCRVILSGQETPGEGEHKIMDYIRFLRSEKGYDSNTRHCLYGLDADLIILGLCTHELHFVILREEVKFTKNSKRTSLEETRFILLYLSLLREYIELDFNELHQYPNFNLGDLIDDWVLMGFLVGNDFIPHLPCLHIASNALPLLYKSYKDIYPSLGGNINEHGTLNLERLEKYFMALSEVELDIFQQNYTDMKYFESKQTKNDINETFNFDVNDIKNSNPEGDFNDLNEASCQLYNEEDCLSDDSDHLMEEFETYKRDYYMNKMYKDGMDRDQKYQQTVAYISALQWILDYYYRGVQSWGWYYPYHYAPFVSDLRNFKDYTINFNMGKPFLPFQQLLAVLPASSKDLLPVAYHDLMTSPNSEIIHFYPNDFETDLNGKQHHWEAVVLIPFIDENLLLSAMERCNAKVTPEEQRRNRHGPMYEYEFTNISQGPLEGIFNLKSLSNVYCTETPFLSKDIAIFSNESVFLELPSDTHTVFMPGFPTMRHLDVEFELRRAGITVFSYPSRYENLILKPVKRTDFDNVILVAEKFLNQVVYIGWPHLIKAKVVAIFNREKYIDSDGFNDMIAAQFDSIVSGVSTHLQMRMGIDFGELTVLVKARTYVGTKLHCNLQGKVTKVDSWSDSIISYPAQGLVSKIPVYNEIINQYEAIEHLYPEESKIFFIGNPYYGSEGTVINPLLVYECGRLKVNITVLPEPDLTDVKFLQTTLEDNYITSYDAATIIGINIKSFNRITACLLVTPKKDPQSPNISENNVNIGLQFKDFKNKTQLVGYAKYVEGHWMYSTTAINLTEEYCRKFPDILKCVNQIDRRYKVHESEIFPNNGEKLQEVKKWLDEQGHLKSEIVKCGAQLLQKDVIHNILQAIEQLKILPVKTVKLQVKPHLLIKPDVTLPAIYKSSRRIRLFDRIVIVRSTYMVPLGARGTVIGIFQDTDKNPVRVECLHSVNIFYDILFDKQVPNGNDIYGIAKGRVQRVPEIAILLTTQESKVTTKQLMSKLDEHLLSEGKRCSTLPNKPMRTIERYSLSTRENRPIIESRVHQPLTKSEENFWMPDNSTKSPEIMNNPLTYASITKNALFPNNADKAPEELQPCHNETMVLKNILGLTPTSTSNLTQEPQVFLKPPDGACGPITPQLPQPPISWFQNTQNMTAAPIPAQSPMPSQLRPTTYSMPRVLCPLPNPYPPISFAPNQILPPSPNLHFSIRQHYSPMSFQPPPQPPPHTYPTHSLDINDRYPRKNVGAPLVRPAHYPPVDRPFQRNDLDTFVPLQVTRNSRQNVNAVTGSAAAPVNQSTANDSAVANCNVDVPIMNTTQTTNSENMQNANIMGEQEQNQRVGERRPPRTPRIAARFDKI